MIERLGPLSLSRQCELLGLNRAALYYQPVKVDGYELELMAVIDGQYLRTPFYGSRRIAARLRTQGHAVDRKPVQRLMQRMNWWLSTSAHTPADRNPRWLSRGRAAPR